MDKNQLKLILVDNYKLEINKKVGSKLRFISKDVKEALNVFYPGLSLLESAYLIISNNNQRECLICKKYTKFESFQNPYPHSFCCVKCKSIALGKISYETRKQNLFSKYGVENIFQLESIIEKSKQQKLNKYSKFHSENGIKRIKESAKLNLLSRTNAAIARRKNFKNKFSNTLIKSGYKLISDSEELTITNSKIDLYSINCNHTFYINHSTGSLNLRCKICYPSESYPHRILLEALKNKFPKLEFKTNYRPKWLNKQEIDIFIESINLGIEINGLFWHSIKSGKDKFYHLTKTETCAKNGITLIQIFEDEIFNNLEKIILFLVDKIKNNETINVDNLDLVELSYVEASNFNEIYDLKETNCIGSICKGLIDTKTKEIKSIIILDKCKNDDKKLELLNFSTVPNIKKKEALSKLLNNLSKPILTFVDRRYFPIKEDNIFSNIGFKYVNTIPPEIWYFKYKEKRFKSDNEITNMLNSDYNVIYDCGNFKFELTK